MLKKNFFLTVLLIFSMAVVIVLSGCSSSDDVDLPSVPEQFEGELEIEYNGLDVKGYVKKLLPGAFTFDITYPEELAGMNIVAENGQITLKFYGIEYKVDSDKLPQSAGIKDIATALDSIAAEISTENPDYDKNTMTLKGSVDGFSYRAIFDSSGVVKKIVFE